MRIDWKLIAIFLGSSIVAVASTAFAVGVVYNDLEDRVTASEIANEDQAADLEAVNAVLVELREFRAETREALRRIENANRTVSR